MKFAAFATPLGKKRWSQRTLSVYWRALCQQEGHKSGFPVFPNKRQYYDGLTERERRTLRLHSEGRSIAAIAAAVGITSTRVEQIIAENL